MKQTRTKVDRADAVRTTDQLGVVERSVPSRELCKEQLLDCISVDFKGTHF